LCMHTLYICHLSAYRGGFTLAAGKQRCKPIRRLSPPAPCPASSLVVNVDGCGVPASYPYGRRTWPEANGKGPSMGYRVDRDVMVPMRDWVTLASMRARPLRRTDVLDATARCGSSYTGSLTRTFCT
jgi:hypothetical protein